MEAVQDIQMPKVPTGFIHHMINFKKAEKAEIYNLIQYPVLAFLPLMILIRINQNLWSKSDNKKGNIELLAEIIGEMILTSLIVFIVFRAVEYIPTFSGEPLKCINILSIITAVIVGLPWYDKDSNIGNKVKIVYERINESLPQFLSLKLDSPAPKSVKKTSILTPTHQPSRADPLPPPQFVEKSASPQNSFPIQDSLPTQNIGPQINQGTQMQPMGNISAANEVLGGFGGSAW